MSAAEEAMAFQLRAVGIRGWEREFAFARQVAECPEAQCVEGKVPGKRKPWIRCPTCRGEGVVVSGRGWRLDIAWPAELIALEIDGGGWHHGRHHRPKGYAEDCEKGAAALLAGWRVLHATPEQVQSGQALAWCESLLGVSACAAARAGR